MTRPDSYRMVEAKSFQMTELEAIGALDAVYAGEYESQFPSPLEIAALCVLMPVVGLVKVCRWTYEKTVALGPVVPVVLWLVLGALAISLPLMLRGAK